MADQRGSRATAPYASRNAEHQGQQQSKAACLKCGCGALHNQRPYRLVEAKRGPEVEDGQPCQSRGEADAQQVEPQPGAEDAEWTPEALGERVASEKKMRKLARGVVPPSPR